MERIQDEKLKEVTGGVDPECTGDVASLRFQGKSVPLPPADSRKKTEQTHQRVWCPVCKTAQECLVLAPGKLFCTVCSTTF